MEGAAGSSTCPDAAFKAAPFMNEPAPAANIYQLLAPVWWIMEGKPASAYDASALWRELQAYTRANTTPIAGVGALCALMLLSLLLLVLWRFVRCVRVVCCQQESYADVAKVLFSRRLRFTKIAMAGLVLAACGMGAWGMASLNRNLLPSLSARIDSVQLYPSEVAARVDSLANNTAHLSQPLDEFSALVASVNVTGLRADVASVAAFLAAAPPPEQLRKTLQTLQAALRPTLFDGLQQLQAQLDVSSSGSGLVELKQHLQVLATFDVSRMAPAIRAYADATLKLFDLIASDASDEEVQASREFGQLRATYTQVDLDAWVPYLRRAVAAVGAIEAMRTPATNPFTQGLASLTTVLATVDVIQSDLLTDIADTVARFNGLWHNNASLAFQSLLDKAAHANASVLALPPTVAAQLGVVNATLADFNSLYAGNASVLQLPQRISDLGTTLALPDAAPLIADLKAAESQLNDAAGLPELEAKLSDLTRVLDDTLRTAKATIQPSLAAFAADPSQRMDLQDTLTFNSPVVQGAAGSFEAARSLGDIRATASSMLSYLQASLGPAHKQAAAIPGVLAQIQSFDGIGRFSATLAQAERLYAQMGSPANLTRPVLALLDEVSAIAGPQLSSARAQIANVTATVRNISASIRAVAIDRVDRVQARWLPLAAGAPRPDAVSAVAGGNASAAAADGGDDGTTTTARLTKAVDVAYYSLMAAYALLLGLLLLLLLAVLRNFPAGACALGFGLNVALVAFALLPLAYTFGLLALRDTCANMEGLAVHAVALKAGNNSMPALAARYYLLNDTGAEGGAANLTGLLKGVDGGFDIGSLRARVNKTVADVLAGAAGDLTLRPEATNVLDSLTARVNQLMSGMDAVLASLDRTHVTDAYTSAKSWLCCDLTTQLFVQWVACLALVSLAWAALQCALAVLHSLDGLSDHCCAFKCFTRRDYGDEPPSSGTRLTAAVLPAHKRTAAALMTSDSAASDLAVAVVSIGAGGAGALGGGDKHPDKPAADKAGEAAVPHAGMAPPAGVDVSWQQNGLYSNSSQASLLFSEASMACCTVPLASAASRMAVVSNKAAEASKAEQQGMLDATPLPPPLKVMSMLTTPPSAPQLPSPRRYPAIPPSNAFGGAPHAPAEPHAARQAQGPGTQAPARGADGAHAGAASSQARERPSPRLLGNRPAINITAMYPSGGASGGYFMPPGSPTHQSTAQQLQQQQASWGNNGSMPGRGLVRAPSPRI